MHFEKDLLSRMPETYYLDVCLCVLLCLNIWYCDNTNVSGMQKPQKLLYVNARAVARE